MELFFCLKPRAPRRDSAACSVPIRGRTVDDRRRWPLADSRLASCDGEEGTSVLTEPVDVSIAGCWELDDTDFNLDNVYRIASADHTCRLVMGKMSCPRHTNIYP